MLGDDEIKENSLMRPGDEIIRFDIHLFFNGKSKFLTRPYWIGLLFDNCFVICFSVHEVCLTDKFYKKDLGLGNEPLFTSSSTNEVRGFIFLLKPLLCSIYFIQVHLIFCLIFDKIIKIFNQQAWWPIFF